ncbi:MAG: oxalate decarboxylase [Mycobacterium sp.]|jgi:oxalate decarboxylase|nr:oxalate decarboxylase [Mycobacterium sp.]
MNPDGTLDTCIMTTGDMYFIPRAYPHHIENIDDLPTFPFTPADPLVVGRVNPVDAR